MLSTTSDRVWKGCAICFCFRTLTARDDTRDRTQIVRAKKKFDLDLGASIDTTQTRQY